VHPTTRLGDRRWADVPGSGDGGVIILVPVGSFEQHGPHLPLDTDTRIAEAVAERAAERIAGALLGPTLTVTASGEHDGFPGTLSIGTSTTTAVIVELVRSADWTSGVVLVNGHGGNATAVGDALRVLRSEERHPLAWWPQRPDGARPDDLHAGWTETSVMLHLHPRLVDLDTAAPGASVTIRELGSRHLIDVTPNGVLGDPTGADPEDGRRILDGWVDDLVTAVAAWSPTPR
jgi:creatinine amidohydrolase